MPRPAEGRDHACAQALLRSAGLPLEGLAQTRLWVEDDHATAGVVGLELRGRHALLRSLAVRPDRRGEGLGGILVAHALQQARSAGAQDAWALTTTIPDWLARLGWRETTRGEVPAEVLASQEFQGACPASARVFSVRL